VKAQEDELRIRLRQQLQVTKRLCRLLDDTGDAAARSLVGTLANGKSMLP